MCDLLLVNCGHAVYDYNVLTQGYRPFHLKEGDPLYSTDKMRECMNRCLKQHSLEPKAYSNLAFYVTSNTYSHGPSYYYRCQCASGPCENWDERTDSKQYTAYRIYNTKSAPTLRPTPAPPSYEKMAYAEIGDGTCKNYMFLPTLVRFLVVCGEDMMCPWTEQVPSQLYGHPLARTFSVICLERICVFCCDTFVSPPLFFVCYFLPLLLKCGCAQTTAGASIRHHLPAVFTDPRDPLYSTDKKRECMMRCLDAHAKAPTVYSNKAFYVMNEKGHYGPYINRCQCTTVKGSCEDWTERTTSKEYTAYRIYDTNAAPTQRPTPVPPMHPGMNYTLIGDGQCRSYKWLPDVSNAAV